MSKSKGQRLPNCVLFSGVEKVIKLIDSNKKNFDFKNGVKKQQKY